MRRTRIPARPEGRRCAARQLVLLSVLVGLLFSIGTAPAAASQAISEFSVGSSNSQAGGHADFASRLRLADAGEPEVASNITVNLPTGVFGNPGATFRCRNSEFVVNHCAPGTQVGLVTIFANFEGQPNYTLGTAPVYNVERLGEDEAARLAFVVPTVDVPVIVPIRVRSASDYGLQMTFSSIPQTVAISGVQFNIWGFPAEPAHNSERFDPGGPGSPPGCPGSTTPSCISAPFPVAGEVVRPFTDNPSVCTGAPLPVSLEVTTYQDPKPSRAEADYPETIGCENQQFDPVFNLALTNQQADSPSGLDIQLKADQFLAGEAPSPSTLRSATLTLPEGLSINPDAADGQSACLDSQAGFGTNLPGACPDSSKIGTVEVITPALETPLIGSLYIGEPESGDQYRVFMIFDGYGIHAKLSASFQPDPKTGQLTMSVNELPQVPFEEFNLHLFASDRGLMATPQDCSSYRAESTLAPWNAVLAPQHSAPVLNVTSGPEGSGCPGQVRPFHPTLEAGTSSPAAGGYSDFTLKLNREDGDQYLGKLNFTMPPGLTANLHGVTYCPEANISEAAQKLGKVEQANPSCPASSEIGTSNVAAGPGSHPFHAVGKLYLAGPFQGAPLSVVAITPALAGPYDYGTVVVRVAIHIDPLDAHVIADSETVPKIIGGIPIRMREIRVNINREHFMINPTNCSPFSVGSEGVGDQGTAVAFSSYFQAVNCGILPFRPRMSVTQLGGHKATARGQDPSIRFDLRTREGDANIHSVAVTLPNTLEIDQNHLGNLCSRSELQATHCQGRQPIGTVSDVTPLLEEPLEGLAYAVSGFSGLPHVAFILGGQVTVVPQGETTTISGQRLRTLVPTVPDVPIGHFQLTLFGQKQGYLANTRNLCRHPVMTTVQYAAQNGKVLTQKLAMKTACGNRAKRPKRRRH